MQEYYNVFKRHGGNPKALDVVNETGMAFLARGLHREGRSPTPAARVSFFMAFGILPSHQEAIEDYLGQLEFDIPSSPCIGPTDVLGIIPVF